MRSKEEINAAIGKLLEEVRKENGWSKSRAAQEFYVDPKTWARYESGESSPSAAEFFFIFEELGANCLPALLQFLYPAEYKALGSMETIEGVRSSLANYIQHIASDRLITTANYLLYGNHGSNIEAQVQELLMLDHLPLMYRYAAAANLKTFWDIAVAKGEIMNSDEVMPNMELFNMALESGRKATVAGNEKYQSTLQGVKNGKGI